MNIYITNYFVYLGNESQSLKFDASIFLVLCFGFVLNLYDVKQYFVKDGAVHSLDVMLLIVYKYCVFYHFSMANNEIKMKQ